MVDYRKILLEYISMVGEAEGVDFIRESENLTPEENAALFEAGADSAGAGGSYKEKLLAEAKRLRRL